MMHSDVTKWSPQFQAWKNCFHRLRGWHPESVFIQGTWAAAHDDQSMAHLTTLVSRLAVWAAAHGVSGGDAMAQAWEEWTHEERSQGVTTTHTKTQEGPQLSFGF